jgi:hypothetical protein
MFIILIAVVAYIFLKNRQSTEDFFGGVIGAVTKPVVGVVGDLICLVAVVGFAVVEACHAIL